MNTEHIKKMKTINTFTDYANRYNCSIAAAIYDRDWPMTYKDCFSAFKEETGREPTATEMQEMHPDSDESCEEVARVLHAEMGDYR